MKNNYPTSQSIVLLKNNFHLFLLLPFILFSSISRSQDVSFSQFYASPVYLNPALAGSTNGPRFVANYRNQWPQINKGYRTYAASYDQQIDKLSGGIGVTVMNDNAGGGILNTTSAGLIYAFRLQISRQVTVSAALQANAVQKRLDWNRLTFGDMIDSRYGVKYITKEEKPSETKNFLDFSSGIFAYSNTVFGGFSISHLTQPNEAFMANGSSKLPMKMTIHAGAMIPIGEKLTRYNGEESQTLFSPNILIQKQGKFNQVNIGTYIQKSAFVCGVWYRANLSEKKKIASDSFIVLVGIQKGAFKLGYSYDMTLNKLRPSSGGAHEISIGFNPIAKTTKKKRFKAIHCPTF